uniref:Uncharacterized protein n=1 Tax=Cucumis melo TaxID=3656 RepID=A0A9I9DMF6_CUCME
MDTRIQPGLRPRVLVKEKTQEIKGVKLYSKNDAKKALKFVAENKAITFLKKGKIHSMVKTSMQSSKKVGTDQDLKDFEPQSDNSMLSPRSLPLDNPFTPLVEEPKDFPIDCNDFPSVDNEELVVAQVDNQLVCVEEDGSTLENKTEEDVLVNGTDIEPFVTTQKSFPLNKKQSQKKQSVEEEWRYREKIK